MSTKFTLQQSCNGSTRGRRRKNTLLIVNKSFLCAVHIHCLYTSQFQVFHISVFKIWSPCHFYLPAAEFGSHISPAPAHFDSLVTPSEKAGMFQFGVGCDLFIYLFIYLFIHSFIYIYIYNYMVLYFRSEHDIFLLCTLYFRRF